MTEKIKMLVNRIAPASTREAPVLEELEREAEQLRADDAQLAGVLESDASVDEYDAALTRRQAIAMRLARVEEAIVTTQQTIDAEARQKKVDEAYRLIEQAGVALEELSDLGATMLESARKIAALEQDAMRTAQGAVNAPGYGIRFTQELESLLQQTWPRRFMYTSDGGYVRKLVDHKRQG